MSTDVRDHVDACLLVNVWIHKALQQRNVLIAASTTHTRTRTYVPVIYSGQARMEKAGLFWSEKASTAAAIAREEGVEISISHMHGDTHARSPS